MPTLLQEHVKLTLNIDGACRGNPGLSGIGAVLTDDSGKVLATLSHFVGILTNNQAEYLALIHGLLWLEPRLNQYGAEDLTIVTDSRLVAMQILQHHKVRNPRLEPLYRTAVVILASYPVKWMIKHVNREENAIADKAAADSLKDLL